MQYKNVSRLHSKQEVPNLYNYMQVNTLLRPSPCPERAFSSRPSSQRNRISLIIYLIDGLTFIAPVGICATGLPSSSSIPSNNLNISLLFSLHHSFKK